MNERDRTKELLFGICVILAIVNLVLIYKMCSCSDAHVEEIKDDFCICSSANVGGRRKMCNGGVTKSDYNSGMTEYQDFATIQKEQGGPFWSNVSPGDLNYPEKDGDCTTLNCKPKEISV